MRRCVKEWGMSSHRASKSCLTIPMVESDEMDFGLMFGQLLRGSGAAIVGCTCLVIVCYYYVDRPVAFFVHDHRIPRFEGVRWLTEPPPLVQSWAPLVLVLLAVRHAF